MPDIEGKFEATRGPEISIDAILKGTGSSSKIEATVEGKRVTVISRSTPINESDRLIVDGMELVGDKAYALANKIYRRALPNIYSSEKVNEIFGDDLPDSTRGLQNSPEMDEWLGSVSM